MEKRAPSTNLIGGWVDPKASLNAVVHGKICTPCQESNPGYPAHILAQSAVCPLFGYTLEPNPMFRIILKQDLSHYIICTEISPTDWAQNLCIYVRI